MMNTKNLIVSTPIEKICDDIYVKREDLSCPPPGPPFGKVRGLYPVLSKLKNEGIKIVSYMDTSISMAGWGVSYFCKELELKSVIFYPKYKEFRHNQEKYIEKWSEFGAEIIPLDKPNMQSINYYRAKKILTEKYPNSIILPQGLPFNETIDNVSDEIKKDFESYNNIKSVVVSVGSGIMCVGILRGLSSLGLLPDVYGVFVAPKKVDTYTKKIFKHIPSGYSKLHFSETKYEYTDKEEMEIPFPCNPYYDAKAYKWMIDNIDSLKKPILFWNIGA